MQSRLILIETNDGGSRILMDLKEDWFISDMTPLHLESNGKPMLLLSMGVNETDMMWSRWLSFRAKSMGFVRRIGLGGLM